MLELSVLQTQVLEFYNREGWIPTVRHWRTYGIGPLIHFTSILKIFAKSFPDVRHLS